MRILQSINYSTAIGFTLILSGCANIDSIYRHGHLSSKGQTEFIDAKQRGVFAIPKYEFVYELARDENGHLIIDDDGNPQRKRDESGNYIPIKSSTVYRMCSEPAPDAFSVRASSTSGRVSKEEEGNFGAVFGMSAAETGATIERTQVINMLRESMFRTCERFMNGAIDKDEMTVQTARDQRMMVATLAIEQLTGVVKRQPTILATNASTTLSADAKALIDKIVEDEAKAKTLEAEVETLKTEKAAAEASYKALNEPEGAAEDAKPFCVAAKEAAETAATSAATTPAATTTTPATTTTVVTTPTATTTAVTTPSPVLAGGVTSATTTAAALVTPAPATTTPAPTNPATPETTTDESATPAVPVATPEQLAACNAAETAASEKTQALSAKEAELAEVRKTIEKSEKRLEYMKTSLMMASGSGEGDAGTGAQSATHLANVANTVEKITLAAFNDQSEINFACVKEFRKPVSHQSAKLLQLCFKAFEGQLLVNAQLASGSKIDNEKLLMQFLGTNPSPQTQALINQNNNLQQSLQRQNAAFQRDQDVQRALVCIAGWGSQPQDITPRTWEWISTKRRYNNLRSALNASQAKRKEILNAC